MSDWPLLSLVIFLPLAGAAFILMIRGEEEVVNQNAKAVALWTAAITFLLSLMIWGNFDNSRSDFQLVEKSEWLAGLNINYHVGVDGISLFLILLSTLTTLVCIGVSWESVQVRVKGIHGRLPGDGDLHGRRLLRARLCALLYLL